MSAIKKVAVVPFDSIEQSGGSLTEPVIPIKSNSIKQRTQIRMHNLLRVMMKIAFIQGYDEEGRIKDSNGEYMENTDIASLLLHAMSPGKLIIGEQQFVELLDKAGVNPDLILNENIRYKLLNVFNSLKSKNIEKIPEVIIESSNEVDRDIKPSVHSKNRGIKRKNSEIDLVEDNESNTESDGRRIKRKRDELPDNWIIPE